MLQDKVVVISGGAGLLGKEYTKAVIENNGIAIVADNDADLAERFVMELQKENNQAKVDFCHLDITSLQSILNLIEYVDKKYGKIDAVVNSAYPRNKNYGRHFFDVEYNDFCENLNLNLGGYFLISQQFAKYFIQKGQGNIINTSSIYGVIPPKFEIYADTPMTMPVEYAAIKSALIHLTKYLAKYLKGKNIRVNAISPGGIFDNQPEKFVKQYNLQSLNKGMLDKSDIKGALVFLLSEMSKNINGQNIIVDDGFSL